jgi:hypothetical protein
MFARDKPPPFLFPEQAKAYTLIELCRFSTTQLQSPTWPTMPILAFGLTSVKLANNAKTQQKKMNLVRQLETGGTKLDISPQAIGASITVEQPL